MKLYAYCLTEGIDELTDDLAGVAGATVRLLKLEGFSLLVSDFADEIVPLTRDNALNHAAVVRSLLDRTTPLPFRFATLVTESELRSYLATRRDALQAKLELVRGCVEMSVKIIWDREWTEKPVRAAIVEEKPGTAFLSEKRREILGSETRAAEAKKIASWLEDRVRETVREARINTNPTDKLMLAVAHLVERGSVGEYQARLKAARSERPELHFLVSGPWAPYSFANIDLEYTSRFGVS
ncbi:MAG TPA: GvpL/GvpF family gas vesicle protein [Pyrinomonadaceae bacterium]|nr:GvpL/GvpF family gas vesicle protein [Pyrinomonadaceae bacterium]